MSRVVAFILIAAVWGVAQFTPSSLINISQWGGVATSLGQKLMTSSVPVVVASNQSSLPVGGSAAVGAAPSGNPLPQGVKDSAGNMIIPDYCTLKAFISGTALATGNTKVISLSGSTTIRICKVSFTTDTLTTFQLLTGTKVTTECDTTPVNQTAVYSGAGGGVFGVAEDYASPLITTSARDLCVALSAGVTSTGGITILYSQR